MSIDKAAVLLSLQQVIQMGIKRHFKSARFDRLEMSGSGRGATFQVVVLGMRFSISLKHVVDEGD